MIDDKWIPSDDELFRAIEKGDERTQQEAKAALVKKYDEKLFARIVAYLRRKNCSQPAAHADGVRNYTWIDALGHLEDLKDWRKFEGWLGTIWKNEANRHLRTCITGETLSVEFTDQNLPDAEIADYYTSRDAAIDIDRMLHFADNMPGFGRLFRLHIVEQLDFDQIAERLRENKEKLRTQYYRGLRKMKDRFQ